VREPDALKEWKVALEEKRVVRMERYSELVLERLPFLLMATRH
jgi:hypothetical protein